ncbi:hypothetical protein QVD17_07291 [Tagetes erecta]|uniref:Uncharacterized protein n=1 Tax=Tagetes erecta TaxID=13708 RepID=A0AAD8LME4_TARER|nr:hypothetical protein QVD17_07291 [Tagetes erecta]
MIICKLCVLFGKRSSDQPLEFCFRSWMQKLLNKVTFHADAFPFFFLVVLTYGDGDSSTLPPCGANVDVWGTERTRELGIERIKNLRIETTPDLGIGRTLDLGAGSILDLIVGRTLDLVIGRTMYLEIVGLGIFGIGNTHELDTGIGLS